MIKDHIDSETMEGRNVVLNDTLNTFYLRLYGIGHIVKDHSDSDKKEGMFYWMTHSTHFIYSYRIHTDR